jgi:hypothetical protein
MSLTIEEIEAEILILPEQDQLKLIDFFESLKSKFVKNKTATETEAERVLAILKKTDFLGHPPDSADLSEHYKTYLHSNEPIAKGQVSSLYQAFDEAGLIGCIETDEQLSTTYKEKMDFSFKHGPAQ